jgi:hypothetical protein
MRGSGRDTLSPVARSANAMKGITTKNRRSHPGATHSGKTIRAADSFASQGNWNTVAAGRGPWGENPLVGGAIQRGQQLFLDGFERCRIG